MYRYLKVAEYIANVTITPVPRNRTYNTESGSTEITNEELLQMIQSHIMDMGVEY